MKYRIESIDISGDKLNVLYSVLNGDNKVISDTLVVPSQSFIGIASDGRCDYIKEQVAQACKKYMVTQDIKTDFSSIIGTEVDLDVIAYETKAEIEARIAAAKEAALLEIQ
jgi:iron only hydrogenase large subunit-like protein